MNVTIEPGTEQDEVIHLENDIAVSIVQKKHPLFERYGCHLLFRKAVSLRDALCGVQFTLRHLDGRVLLLSNETGSVVQPGTLLSVPGEGFRVKKKGREFGDLFILFDVIFPKPHEINVGRLQQISASERVDESAEVTLCHFADARLEDFGGTKEEDYEEDIYD
jgi:DnaJ family protein A protein 2